MQNQNNYLEYSCVPIGTVGLSIILNGEGFLNYQNEWRKLPRVFIYGLVSKTQIHKLSPGYKVIGLRLKPEFLQLLMKEKVSFLPKRQATDLCDLMPKEEVTWLYENLLSANEEIQIVNTVNTFLKKNYFKGTIDKKVAYSLNKIRSGEVNNVELLSKDMNVSSTYMRSLFHRHVGITPKELIKIERFRKALKTRRQNEEGLAGLAYDLGYYDQSHFIHEFKNTIGITPLKYFSNNKLTYDFYNFQRWKLDSFVP
ncbi:MAG: AraC family transcriptional regulator [Bacteroidetes bacterium]|jgi:AraC-like DNA-binding protein|nr:AraC family transcriptional regulator [Bacteroidota bacterium]